MSDKADPLRIFHQRQVDDQATPVTIYSGGGGGDSGGPLVVQLSGSNGERDLRGLISERPAAAPGNKGWTFWAVDDPSGPGTVYVSDGSAWSVLVDLTA